MVDAGGEDVDEVEHDMEDEDVEVCAAVINREWSEVIRWVNSAPTSVVSRGSSVRTQQRHKQTQNERAASMEDQAGSMRKFLCVREPDAPDGAEDFGVEAYYPEPEAREIRVKKTTALMVDAVTTLLSSRAAIHNNARMQKKSSDVRQF
jgi:hypothetical protein